MAKKLKLLKAGKKDEAAKLLKRRQKYSGLIDKKIERYSGDSLALNKENKTLLENSKRAIKKPELNKRLLAVMK